MPIYDAVDKFLDYVVKNMKTKPSDEHQDEIARMIRSVELSVVQHTRNDPYGTPCVTLGMYHCKIRDKGILSERLR